MTSEAILAALQTLFGLLPGLLSLFDRLKSGTPVSEAEIEATFSQYNVDRTAFMALLAPSAPPTAPPVSGAA